MNVYRNKIEMSPSERCPLVSRIPFHERTTRIVSKCLTFPFDVRLTERDGLRCLGGTPEDLPLSYQQCENTNSLD